MMTKVINRRSVIVSAGALAAIAPLPLKAAESDAEIVRLFAAYREAEERDRAAYEAWEQARDKAAAKARKAGVRPSLEALEEWETAIVLQAEALGLTPIRIAHEEAEAARYEAWQALADAPAQTVTGIALKLVALFQWDDELEDVWNGKSDGELGHIMCLAARADALRLAHLPHTFGTEEV